MKSPKHHFPTLEYECEFSYVRSSGPGGQNVNKVNSKAVLRWPIAASVIQYSVLSRFRRKFTNRINRNGEVVLQSDRYRDQRKNKKDCYDKLYGLLMEVRLPPKKRRKTKPSRASKERRLQSKKRRGDTKKGRSWKYKD